MHYTLNLNKTTEKLEKSKEIAFISNLKVAECYLKYVSFVNNTVFDRW